MATYLKELYDKPCTCVRCDTCKGFGSIDDPMDYSGTYPRTCDDCNGSGMTEVCERCMDIEEIERDSDWV